MERNGEGRERGMDIWYKGWKGIKKQREGEGEGEVGGWVDEINRDGGENEAWVDNKRIDSKRDGSGETERERERESD